MKFFTSAFLALSLSLEIVQTRALPSSPLASNSTNSTSCSSVEKRREWRTLTNDEKLAYIDGVKCLQSLPSTAGIMQEVTSRYEDFVAAHIVLGDEIHWVAHFLPWHRWYLYLFGKALKEECGYEGAQPYWNWSLDVSDGLKSLVASPVFDPTYGFGGNGADVGNYTGIFNNNTDVPGWNQSLSTGGGCLTDGPFVSYSPSIGPGRLVTKHCLQRGLSGSFLHLLTEETIQKVLDTKTFWTGFQYNFAGWPSRPRIPMSHDAGHLTISGDMGDFYSSPNDPLFFLHHANVDRIWWKWQVADPEERLYLIDGLTTMDPPYEETSLDYPLKMAGMAPTIPLKQVMDTENGLLCYSYE